MLFIIIWKKIKFWDNMKQSLNETNIEAIRTK